MKPEIDWAKVKATTKEDIRRHMIEDVEDPAARSLLIVVVRDPQAALTALAVEAARAFSMRLRAALVSL